MTYCIGYWLEKGLVMASDSRTSAGVDYISSYSKMHRFQPAPDRLFVLLAAGSLATTQAVISWIRRDLDRHADLEQGAGKDLRHCDYLFEAAAYIGRVSQAVQKENEAALKQSGSSGAASFILGGQIGSEAHGLYLIYRPKLPFCRSARANTANRRSTPSATPTFPSKMGPGSA
jgi:putative proteasome-type protease